MSMEVFGGLCLVLALVLLWHIRSEDRHENLKGLVLDAVAELDGRGTGDEVAALVEEKAGRVVGLSQVYALLCELRRDGVVVSEAQKVLDEYREISAKEPLPAVWRLTQPLDG